MTTTIPTTELNDGSPLPVLGLGTFALKGPEGAASMAAAIRDGYRLLDTAARYENEPDVGQAIRESGVPREELVVTSKVRGADQGYDPTMHALERSLSDLRLDYLDLYLIHWPLPRLDEYVNTWHALITAREQGLVRSIGVSNFTAEHLDRLAAETDVVPAVNQIELHPHFPQAQMRAVNAERGIVTESWSPLGRKTEVLAHEVIAEVAAAHEVTPAQAVLRWHVQLGAVAIPKSGTPERWRANLDVFGFELTDDEMDRITALESGRVGGDPDTHEEF